MAGKTSTRHPYAATEHRVIDSPAYADLSYSARSLLTLFTRQLTRDNNGHLQAAFTWCNQYGFGSEHTLRLAIAELIAHGFIYRTKSHGANGVWSQYAVTWLPIKKLDGLYLGGFVSCAWRDWQPMTNGKSSRQKLLITSGRKCSFTPELPAETAGKHPAETAAYELIPCREVISACPTQRSLTEVSSPIYGAWITGFLAELAKAGLAGKQCFQLPPTRTLQ